MGGTYSLCMRIGFRNYFGNPLPLTKIVETNTTIVLCGYKSTNYLICLLRDIKKQSTFG